MVRSWVLALLILFAVTTGAAQEVDEAPATEANSGAADAPDTDSSTDTEDEFDDADLDQQTYEEDEDVFVPTEEIPADEPIPFPTNI